MSVVFALACMHESPRTQPIQAMRLSLAPHHITVEIIIPNMSKVALACQVRITVLLGILSTQCNNCSFGNGPQF